MQTSAVRPKLRKGGTAPPFQLPSTQGGMYGPGALRSKYNMVLAFLDDTPGGIAYLRELARLHPDILAESGRLMAVVPVSLDAAHTLALREGLPFPLLADEGGSVAERMLGAEKQSALCVADRFGEIYFLEAAPTSGALPPARSALDWLGYIEVQCPE